MVLPPRVDDAGHELMAPSQQGKAHDAARARAIKGSERRGSRPAPRVLIRRWSVLTIVVVLLVLSVRALIGSHPTASPGTPAATSGIVSSSEPVRLATSLASWRLGAPVSRTIVVRKGAGLIILGGLATGDTSTSSIWQLNPLTGSINRAGVLADAVHDSAGVALGKSVLVFGGGSATTLAEVQSWEAGTTRVIGSLPVPRSDLAAVVLGSHAYVLGGFDGTKLVQDILSTTDGTHFRRVSALAQPVRYPAVAAANGAVWIVGGELGTAESALSGGQTNDIQRFDPQTGVTTVIGHLPVTLGHASAVAIGGRLFVLGGRTGSSLSNRIWQINTKSGTVSNAGTLAYERSDAGVGVIGNQAWLFGGETSGPLNPLDSVVALRVVQPQANTAAQSAPLAVSKARTNIYAAAGANLFSPVVRHMPYRIYVPESGGSDVDVIDPKTFKVIYRYHTGLDPQHVVPAWNLKTLYAANDLGNSLTPISPYTGKPSGPNIAVDDPYNMYFTPNGHYAIVVEEANQILAFRNPRTFALIKALPVNCAGVDHGDFSADGSYAIFSCEFSGKMVKINVIKQSVIGYLSIPGSAPQDVKLNPAGTIFYTADMNRGGVYEIDAATFKVIGFIPTGRDAHGLYTSRNARYMYVSNRGSGSVSVIDLARRRVKTTWYIPGGGSPDMGNVSPDGKVLWLSGRYNACVYAISTVTGRLLAEVPVPNMPHGLAVWPEPGRYSLGHTGIMR